jgi:uncharacterized protein YjiS (DUF1127 family)
MMMQHNHKSIALTLAKYAERLGHYARLSSRRWRARKTIASLRMLDDHILRDIGVARSEISEAAMEAIAFAPPPIGSRSRTQPSQQRRLPYDHLANFAR